MYYCTLGDETTLYDCPSVTTPTAGTCDPAIALPGLGNPFVVCGKL